MQRGPHRAPPSPNLRAARTIGSGPNGLFRRGSHRMAARRPKMQFCLELAPVRAFLQIRRKVDTQILHLVVFASFVQECALKVTKSTRANVGSLPRAASLVARDRSSTTSLVSLRFITF